MLAAFFVGLWHLEADVGDDLNIVIPTTEENEERTYDEIGQELVDLLSLCMSRIDNLTIQIGEQNARIVVIEASVAEFVGREYALIGHTHEEFALAEHNHDDRYAPIEHSHEENTREKDTAPEKQHFWYRKLGS